MKKFFILFLPVLFIACASKKDSAALVNGAPVLESQCPPEGMCEVILHKDKGLFEKYDKFNRIQYEMIDKPGAVVVAYAYNKTKNADYEDGSYSEELVFETNAQLSNLTTGLMPKMYFKVNCFCRGKAGTYAVTGGDFSREKSKIHITLPQIVDNQLTKQIDVLFK